MGDGVARGRHRVFLGMASGAGKTYRMLQEAQAEAAAGRDVVIGYLESQPRPDTTAQAAGLEVVPRRRVSYRGLVLTELDLPAVLARRPELCLIDELAHANAPGLEHRKRCDDVRAVLAAGIDVFSTVNVQHLESLNDRVTELTGARVRETLPDEVLLDAAEVVLVDVTPEELIRRLRAGKVYPRERVEAALAGFFTLENLAALRELALLQVADEVDIRLWASRAGPPGAGERLLALVTPTAGSLRVAWRAWRAALRLQADLDLLWVKTHEPDAQERAQLDGLRRLAGRLGARLLVQPGDDVALAVSRVAARRGSTYVFMGAPPRRPRLRRLAGPGLPVRLLELLPGVDLRIVARPHRRVPARSPSLSSADAAPGPPAPDGRARSRPTAAPLDPW